MRKKTGRCFQGALPDEVAGKIGRGKRSVSKGATSHPGHGILTSMRRLLLPSYDRIKLAFHLGFSPQRAIHTRSRTRFALALKKSPFPPFTASGR